MSYGPTTDPEIRAKQQAQLDEQSAAIDAAIAKCSHCKTAKTAARKRIQRSLQKLGKGSAFSDNPKLRERHVEQAKCKQHKHAHHLAYVTSPLSETYWCS